MGTVNALLDPLLVGFLSVVVLNVARYWLIHQTGYWFFLPVLLIGTVLMSIADVSLTALEQFLDSESSDWRFSPGSTKTWAMMLAALMTFVANVLIGRERSARLAAKWRGNLIECLMLDSINSGSLIELTLDTGKSYVGLVVDSGVATPNESDVSIIPVFSGHRDSKHKLQLTTSYRDALLKASPDEPDDYLSPFELVLSKNQIVSVRRFDVGIFANHFGRPLPESS